MLKRLAIFAVVLSVASAFVPASGQAPNKGTHDRKGKGQPANASANPSQTAMPVAAQESGGDSLKPKSDGSPNDHQQATINISNSASVTEWTWHDKVAWIFGLVLTGFLVWGVIVAQSTLRAIKEQAKETARAARATEDAAVATKGAAEAARLNAQAVINAERGRLLFEIKMTLGEQFHGVGIFKIIAVNYGRVPVEILGFAPPTQTVVKFPNDLPPPPNTNRNCPRRIDSCPPRGTLSSERFRWRIQDSSVTP